MDMAQKALGETPPGTPSLQAPAREAAAFLIVETLLCHHFHLEQEWIIVNNLRYHQKCHHSHQNLRIQASSTKLNFPTSFREIQRTRTSPAVIGYRKWMATSHTSKMIPTMTTIQFTSLELSCERKV
jgi:hypothetical protein